jgi:phytoene dehydrogenase-like protein
VPFATWLDANVEDARARALVEAFVRLSTYANAPGRVSTGAALRQLRQASKTGVLYLDDGWQTLVDGLALAARKAGVQVMTSAGVEDVAPDGAAWRALQSDGSVLHARSVILAVGPRAAHKAVSGSAKPVLQAWADACVPAHAACLDVALRSLPRRAPTFALGIDAPLYFSVHSKAARLAPPGGAMIHAMKYLPAGHHTHGASDESELEAWLDRLQPGWRDRVVAKRFLPSVVATNDIARADVDGTRGRPGPGVPGAPGLFVVGDWVGSEGMLVDASLASATESAAAVLRAHAPTTASEAAA